MRSWLEISKPRLVANVQQVREAAHDAEIVAIVKADAYGHGVNVVAPMLLDAGVRWLGVNDLDEALVVRAVLGKREVNVLVLCGLETHQAPFLLHLDTTCVVWMPEQVYALNEAARLESKRVAVHLEIETGMARQGATVGAELAEMLDALADSEYVRCEGVMTHLCCSEVRGARTTTDAMRLFEQALEQLHAGGVIPQYLHIANTSAIDEQAVVPWLEALARVDSATVMVRPGLALYGYALPMEGGHGVLASELQPVMHWTTRVLALREIAEGATVGYGATFTATRTMRLALLQVGYADGLTRRASSGMGDGWVMVRGERAPVVGRVSMNLTVVDVTEIAGVEIGDEVVVLGEGVSAEDHAQWAGTMVYEVLCGMRAMARDANPEMMDEYDDE
ncbi:MAG: alanine racemase [Bryocella sp.]